jgi:hypothetical protein
MFRRRVSSYLPGDVNVMLSLSLSLSFCVTGWMQLLFFVDFSEMFT